MARKPVDALILAIPETAGSALYGMVDVLSATGNLWQTLVGSGSERRLIRPRIVSSTLEPFRCGNGIPVAPDQAVSADPFAEIVIIPEIWLSPAHSVAGRHPEIMEWLRGVYRRGATIYSACSGSILLAESGLLNGREATSHWGYEELFRQQYPDVEFRGGPNLVFADPAGRIVTAGGTTSWHDLAIHIIARNCGSGEALRISKVYLLKWHEEGQLPYASLVRRHHHADSAARGCEEQLRKHYLSGNALQRAIRASAIPERTLKRRFKAATGSSLIEYLQRLRIEDAKGRLESTKQSVDAIGAEVGYEDPAFFRRLFKRHTGLTPGAYRRLFSPISEQSRIAERIGANADRKGMHRS